MSPWAAGQTTIYFNVFTPIVAQNTSTAYVYLPFPFRMRNDQYTCTVRTGTALNQIGLEGTGGVPATVQNKSREGVRFKLSGTFIEGKAYNAYGNVTITF